MRGRAYIIAAVGSALVAAFVLYLRQTPYAPFWLISDQTLADTALSGGTYQIRAAATLRLKDQELLGRIVERKEEDNRVKAAAVEALQDQEVLGKITRNPKIGSWERVAAIRKLDNQNVLREVAEIMWDVDVATAAVERLNDPRIIRLLAVNTTLGYSVREAAIKKIRDETVLLEISGSDPIPKLRRLAACQIPSRRAEVEAEYAERRQEKVAQARAQLRADCDRIRLDPLRNNCKAGWEYVGGGRCVEPKPIFSLGTNYIVPPVGDFKAMEACSALDNRNWDIRDPKTACRD
jgi:hypothetical protein